MALTSAYCIHVRPVAETNAFLIVLRDIELLIIQEERENMAPPLHRCIPLFAKQGFDLIKGNRGTLTFAVFVV